MAFFDNSNFVRSTMGTQLANLQGNMAPSGAMWEQYLNNTNPLMNNISQVQDPFTQMLLGQMPGYLDANAAYQNSLSPMLSGLAGNTQGNLNTIAGMQGGLAGQMAGYIDPFMQQFINGGQNPLTDYIQNELTGFGGNYANNQMGAQGNQLLANGGQTPYTQNMKDISSYLMQQGGFTDQMKPAMAGMNGMINSGGMTPGLQGAMGIGANLATTGGIGQQPGLSSAINFGQGQLSSGGMSPLLNSGAQGVNNILSTQGRTPEISALQQSLGGEIGSGGYGQLQPGFEQAQKMMNGGGLSEFYGKGGNLAEMYASGNGPSFTQGLGMSMPTFQMPSIGGVSAGSVSRGPVDSGYTGSINEVLAKAKEILNENPLMDFNKALTMARDQSATATVQGQEAAYRRAAARGGAPGSVVGSGLQNAAMSDYADMGAQNEAAAMRDAAKTQQGLQLSKYGIGADLAKGLEQVAASRNASSSQLAGQEMSANASLQGAAMSANAQLQAQQAQLALQAYNAQAGLFGNLAQLKAQQQMGGLEALLGFSNQGNQQIQAGLSAMPALQNSANNRLGIATEGFLKGSELTNQRELGALGAIPGISNAANANMNTGLAGIIDSNKILSGNVATGAGLMSNTNDTASKNFLGSLNAAPNFQNAATNMFTAAGNQGIAAGQLENQTMELGGKLSQNYIDNNLKSIGMLQNQNNSNATNAINGVNAGIGLNTAAQTGLTNAANTTQGAGNFGLNQFGKYTEAQNSAFENWLKGNALMSGVVQGNNTTQAGLAAAALAYMQGAQQGYAGIGASQGGGSPFQTIGNTTANLVNSATGAYNTKYNGG